MLLKNSFLCVRWVACGPACSPSLLLLPSATQPHLLVLSELLCVFCPTQLADRAAAQAAADRRHNFFLLVFSFSSLSIMQGFGLEPSVAPVLRRACDLSPVLGAQRSGSATSFSLFSLCAPPLSCLLPFRVAAPLMVCRLTTLDCRHVHVAAAATAKPCVQGPDSAAAGHVHLASTCRREPAAVLVYSSHCMHVVFFLHCPANPNPLCMRTDGPARSNTIFAEIFCALTYGLRPWWSTPRLRHLSSHHQQSGLHIRTLRHQYHQQRTRCTEAAKDSSHCCAAHCTTSATLRSGHTRPSPMGAVEIDG